MEDAATGLGKSVRQVRYMMIQQGRMKARKCGGCWLVMQAAAEDILGGNAWERPKPKPRYARRPGCELLSGTLRGCTQPLAFLLA